MLKTIEEFARPRGCCLLLEHNSSVTQCLLQSYVKLQQLLGVHAATGMAGLSCCDSNSAASSMHTGLRPGCSVVISCCRAL